MAIQQTGVDATQSGNWSVSAINPDAALFRISSVGGDAGVLRTSAIIDNGSVSAKSSDASTFRISAIGTVAVTESGTWTLSAVPSEGTSFIGNVSATIKNYPLTVSGTVSAFINQGTVSAYSPDAALFRVSGIGTFITSAHEVKQSDAAALLISAKSGDAAQLRISAIVDSGSVSAKSSDAGTMLVSGKQGDAGLFRVSGIIDTGSVSAKSSDASTLLASAKQGDAGLLLISAKQGDAALFRISAFLDSGSVSAKSTDATNLVVSAVQKDAALFRVSGIIDTGSISAKSGDANNVHVSTVQGDAGLLRISSMGSDAGNDRTSALQGSADLLRVSGFTATATNFPVSATQANAGLFRASAMLFGNTTGGMTISRSLNCSTSFTAKATAGAVYGWYAWNSDTKPLYIRLMNTSGAINVGTDVPIVTIRLNASGVAETHQPMGLKGFTAGIGVYATSVVLDNSTTGGVASAVGINLFYV